MKMMTEQMIDKESDPVLRHRADVGRRHHRSARYAYGDCDRAVRCLLGSRARLDELGSI